MSCVYVDWFITFIFYFFKSFIDISYIRTAIDILAYNVWNLLVRHQWLAF